MEGRFKVGGWDRENGSEFAIFVRTDFRFTTLHKCYNIRFSTHLVSSVCIYDFCIIRHTFLISKALTILWPIYVFNESKNNIQKLIKNKQNKTKKKYKNLFFSSLLKSICLAYKIIYKLKYVRIFRHRLIWVSVQ